jgi:hypothetical protein
VPEESFLLLGIPAYVWMRKQQDDEEKQQT